MRDWTLEYEGYYPAQERLRESLCTLGNGYFATRGAAPECAADTVAAQHGIARYLLVHIRDAMDDLLSQIFAPIQ